MNESWLYNILLDTVSEMELEGYAGSYIQSMVKAVKSGFCTTEQRLREG